MTFPRKRLTADEIEAYTRRSQQGSCFVCQIVSGKSDYKHHMIYEDDHAIVFLSMNQPLYGNTLVAPSQHREHVAADFTTDEYLSLQRLIHAVGNSVQRAVPTERLYVLSLGSQQGNRHVHWRIAPLPPGVPYDRQQLAALGQAAGVLNMSEADKAQLARRIAAELERELRHEPAPRPILRGGRVVLRPPRLNDKEDGLKAGRDPELVMMYGGDYRNVSPLTPGEVGRWYERLQSDPLAWVIEADGRCIGHCRLHSLDKDNRCARFAIGIFNRAFWGKGFGTEATRLILKHAFEELKLHRVDLRVLHYNERAIAAFKKCGFVEEGRERDSVLVAGEWHTDIRMSILEHEYDRRPGS